MKKKFVKPLIEVVNLESVELICDSRGGYGSSYDSSVDLGNFDEGGISF